MWNIKTDNCNLRSLLSHEPQKKVNWLPAVNLKVAEIFLIYSICLNKVHWGFGFVHGGFMLVFGFTQEQPPRNAKST